MSVEVKHRSSHGRRHRGRKPERGEQGHGARCQQEGKLAGLFQPLTRTFFNRNDNEREEFTTPNDVTAAKQLCCAFSSLARN